MHAIRIFPPVTLNDLLQMNLHLCFFGQGADGQIKVSFDDGIVVGNRNDVLFIERQPGDE